MTSLQLTEIIQNGRKLVVFVIVVERKEQFPGIGQAKGLCALEMNMDVFEAQGIFLMEKLIELDHEKSALALLFGNIGHLADQAFCVIFRQIQQVLNVIDRPGAEKGFENLMDLFNQWPGFGHFEIDLIGDKPFQASFVHVSASIRLSPE